MELYRVLLVDDEEDIREGISRKMENHEYYRSFKVRPMLMTRRMRLENYLIWKQRGIFIHVWQIQRLVQ